MHHERWLHHVVWTALWLTLYLTSKVGARYAAWSNRRFLSRTLLPRLRAAQFARDRPSLSAALASPASFAASRVALTSYGDYAPYVDAMCSRHADGVLVPGRPLHLAITSGTTTGVSKMIPPRTLR
eukprot:TRINITY_DN4565_c0_g1_i1.p2 TRINITY_DN4565_c0_g1~~TRINITY_DN4565_c0_g1_i1.p2  ORF type:complete len:126 (+),score=27.73 TRINITY_DN4565_c0_g1_i1:260-637(+)